MNLSSLLSDFGTQAKVASAEPVKPTEKTAGDKTTQSPALASALAATIEAVGTEKQASAPPTTPSDAATGVRKLAENVLGLDKEADLRHAAQMGSCIADGFISRLNWHKEAAAQLTSKEASDMGVTAEELALVKMARDNPAEFLAEVQRGYEAGLGQAEKQAAQTYDETYTAIVRGIHKTAADHYAHGYAVADAILREAAK